MSSAERTPGRIVTFYSYKGGTGRSMALANAGWVLASSGLRVLLVDWDLEAPGLHRYLHPFLDDKELSASPGLIDYFWDFAAAARRAGGVAAAGTRQPNSGDEWWSGWTSLLRYTYSLNWTFPSPADSPDSEATLDFVPAGQQDAGYGLRVTSFNWQEFYEKLGGGVLLEALKQQLRHDYDYVLIDSRTGITDTAGICTIQMPDDLVTCFTFNRQSIAGAAAIAGSADAQRRSKVGEPELRIWPVPMRVELAEKERLDRARGTAQRAFQRYLGRLTRSDRARYWDSVEVLYEPFYAYEEVLAPFAERLRSGHSMLSSIESLLQWVTGRSDLRVPRMTEAQRQDGLARFSRAEAVAPVVFLSYHPKDAALADRIRTTLEASGVETRSPDQTPGGANWLTAAKKAIEDSAVALFIRGDSTGTAQRIETGIALEAPRTLRILPVVPPGATPEPSGLDAYESFKLSSASDLELASLGFAVARLLKTSTEESAADDFDPDDPQKGRWGGSPVRNGRTLSASVTPLSGSWYQVDLAVTADPGADPLAGFVTFHLHQYFPEAVKTVPVKANRATLRLSAWGAFTVGAVADEGRTTLELDLAEQREFPELFRAR